MKITSAPRPVRWTRPLTLLASVALTLLATAAPVMATEAATPVETNPAATATLGDVTTLPTAAELPQLDKNGVPYLETVRNSLGISKALASQLAIAGEVKGAYLDDAVDLGALITVGGVVLGFTYDASPELLDALISSGVDPKFVQFIPAPVTEKERIAREQPKFDWAMVGMILPILMIISALAIFSQIRDRRRRQPELNDDETAYQTREGPAGTIPTVTFEDVAGCEEAIEDLSEIVEFLKDPEKFERLGAQIPRGALLVGPPGTGKTLLARAVAGQAKVAFFAASGSDFVEMYVGVGPARVRELFTKARAAEKAIIFIDEIDAVARSRAMSTKQNANDERENTLNALLHELDGFSRSNVILLAATNRVDILDPAIIRPGRLDRKIQVPNPDRRGREKILGVHTAGKPLAKDVDLGAIAKRTPGMSGADLAQIANEAAIEGVRRNLKSIDASCFSSAVALVAMGRARRSALVTDRDRLITAYHEAGHTVCALVLPDAPNPAGVSITPRGHAGGITWMNGTDDQYMARSQAAAQLVVALGGRAGEELLLDGEFTQGPSSDLERATQLATVMVTRYGMTRRGLAVRPGEPDGVSHDVIEELLTCALDDARGVIRDNRALFLAIVNQLLEHETLEGTELADIASSIEPGAEAPGFAEHTARALQHAGHVAVEAATEAAVAVGNAVVKAGRKVRRQTSPVDNTNGNGDGPSDSGASSAADASDSNEVDSEVVVSEGIVVPKRKPSVSAQPRKERRVPVASAKTPRRAKQRKIADPAGA